MQYSDWSNHDLTNVPCDELSKYILLYPSLGHEIIYSCVTRNKGI